jgi:hypothetical protein
MDHKLLDSVNKIIKNKGNQWEPTCISVNTYSGTVNLMDCLLGGKAPSPILLLDNAQAGTDPNDQINRKPIITKLRNACAEAGFELSCKAKVRPTNENSDLSQSTTFRIVVSPQRNMFISRMIHRYCCLVIICRIKVFATSNSISIKSSTN